jgi:hypothetical protein
MKSIEVTTSALILVPIAAIEQKTDGLKGTIEHHIGTTS